jgi:hypothetical protein
MRFLFLLLLLLCGSIAASEQPKSLFSALEREWKLPLLEQQIQNFISLSIHESVANELLFLKHGRKTVYFEQGEDGIIKIPAVRSVDKRSRLELRFYPEYQHLSYSASFGNYALIQKYRFYYLRWLRIFRAHKYAAYLKRYQENGVEKMSLSFHRNFPSYQVSGEIKATLHRGMHYQITMNIRKPNPAD